MLSENGFIVNIRSEDYYARPLIIDDADYIALHSGVEYAITLTNNRPTIADADISIDGDSIGIFRLDPYKSFRIERPGDNERKFTFKSELSVDAIEAGAIPGDSENGLIQVTFKPAKYERYNSPTRRSVSPSRQISQTRRAPASQQLRGTRLESASQSSNFSSGVTLLGDRSYQRFNDVIGLRPDQIDYPNITRIVFRLIVDDPQPKYESIKRRSRSPPRYPSAYPPRIDYH